LPATCPTPIFTRFGSTRRCGKSRRGHEP
jgi:hypothetical protein